MDTILLIFTLLDTEIDFDTRISQIYYGWDKAVSMCRMRGIELSLHYAKPNVLTSFHGIEVHIFVRCLKLLHCVNIRESDLPIIFQKIQDVLWSLGIDLEELTACHVDFCHNFIVVDKKERMQYMKLFAKSHWTFYKAVRKDPEEIENYNNLYWSCIDKHNKKHTQVFNLQLYDKTEERNNKGIKPEEYEEHVLRLEFQVRERLVQKKAAKGFPNGVFDWINWDVRAKALASTQKLFYSGDFYTLRKAYTILKHSGLPLSRCDEIRQFMSDISQVDVDFAFSRTTKYRAEKYISQLSALGINPIPIPQNAGMPFLKNPLRAFYEGGCVA